MKTGDIILFKGNGLFSALITALPGAEYSHVGLFVDHPTYGHCVFESTSLGTLPDVTTGRMIRGVQLVPFDERVNGYDGDVFHRPIVGSRTNVQDQAIYSFMNKYHGTPYEKDNLQLVRAELDLFPWQQNKEDDSSLFCSETVIMCLRAANIAVDGGYPANEFTPTDCSNNEISLMNDFVFGRIVPI